jgi:hypothetical protein
MGRRCNAWMANLGVRLAVAVGFGSAFLSATACMTGGDPPPAPTSCAADACASSGDSGAEAAGDPCSGLIDNNACNMCCMAQPGAIGASHGNSDPCECIYLQPDGGGACGHASSADDCSACCKNAGGSGLASYNGGTCQCL